MLTAITAKSEVAECQRGRRPAASSLRGEILRRPARHLHRYGPAAAPRNKGCRRSRIDVDVGLRHHEHQVAKHARLVQYLDDKYLPLTVSNPSRVENPSSLLRISGNEVDKAVTFATHPLDRFDIDPGLTEHLPASSQRAGSVLQRDVELNCHSVWPSVRWALQLAWEIQG